MAATKYSKSHEREERAKIGKGFLNSLFAILLCWLPVVGLLLAITGFSRMVVRVTARHRARLALGVIFSLIALAVCVGALMWELWTYSRDPSSLDTAVKWTWTALTGQENLPGEASDELYDVDDFDYGYGVDYSDEGDIGLGVPDDEDAYAEYEDEGFEEDFTDEDVLDEDVVDDGVIDEEFTDDDFDENMEGGEDDLLTQEELAEFEEYDSDILTQDDAA